MTTTPPHPQSGGGGPPGASPVVEGALAAHDHDQGSPPAPPQSSASPPTAPPRAGEQGWGESAWLAELPTFALRRLRALARASELALTAWACLIGVLGGLLAVAFSRIAREVQRLAFAIPADARLATLDPADLLTRAWVPILGGAILAAIALWWARTNRGVPVDPVEANALRGGRMSLRDSLVVAAQTLISAGSGGPLGVEVGSGQLSSAAASKLGRVLRLKRHDLRDLVGAGSAATLAATLGAPLAGAFFAFEVVVGAYSLGNVAPVVAASVIAVLTARALGAGQSILNLETLPDVALGQFPALMLLALLCAALGVAVMKGGSVTASTLDAAKAPKWLRPILAGAAVAAAGLAAPAILGSGGGALDLAFSETAIGALILLATLKLVAASLAIGGGFRGGMFTPSLFIGGLTGKLFALAALALVPAAIAPEPGAAVLVGMAALTAAVIGAPLCMTFLVLESTGDIAVSAAVLAAAVLSNLIVRETFGYSFSTWRLHLRGERVRGAHDVGLLRELTVGSIMKRSPRLARADTPLSAFCSDWPLGSKKTVVAIDADGRYAGMLWVDDCHALADRASGSPAPTVGAAADATAPPLTADTPVQQALRAFDRSGAPALAVVRSAEDPVVIGVLGEAYATRRLAEALDAARKGVVGY